MAESTKTLVDYVRQQGNVSFVERELNMVDAAIFAQLSYLDYTVVPADLQPTLAVLNDAQLLDQMNQGIWMGELNKQLLKAIAQSARFKSISWHDAVNTNDPDIELQFAAITFEIGPDHYFVAYRGTQATLLDWKEDFNMTYLEAVPSQKLAARYLKQRVQAKPGHYYVGGHSKGGNLAVFALAHSDQQTQMAIQKVFNFDGPGFKETLPKAIISRVAKFVPESTVIGLLLETTQEFQIVKSTAIGINQHNLLTWELDGDQFVFGETLKWSALYLQRAIDAWLSEMSLADRQLILDAVYAIFKESDINQFKDFKQAVPTNTKMIVTQIQATDPEIRQQVTSSVGELLQALLTAGGHEKPKTAMPTLLKQLLQLRKNEEKLDK